jgi:ketosteroid isomerase-like protein
MKRILFVAGLLLLAGTYGFGQNNAKLQAQLIQMDKDWTAAELKGDAKTASSFIADDYWGTMPDGTMENKAQYTKAIKASKDTDFADDYSVRFFGDTAIMTHRGTVKGERSFQYRSTHVWMNRGGKWQIVAHHSSEIPAGAAAAPTTKKPSMTGAPAPASVSNDSNN